MSELRDLFQAVILDHYKSPRNAGTLDQPTHQADGHNALCGDRIHLTATVDNGMVTAIRHATTGCAICSASASIMSDLARGHTVDEIARMHAQFHDLATGKITGADLPEAIDKLEVFSGVANFPARVKCATLPWHTLQAALGQAAEPVSTE